jgi:hypothetical protein
VIPLNRLFGFVQEHGKTLASVSESLDLSTWIGRLVANVIAGVAEGELEAIRERNLGSQRKLRELGRWHGQGVPYGYTTVRRSDGWYLIPDAEECRVLREVILPLVLSHRSTNSIAAQLNDDGIPTRKGGPWSGQVLRTILRRKALLGQHEHNGRVVCDEKGLPQLRAEPLLTQSEYDRVQTALKSRSVRSGAKYVNPLAGVLFCYLCEAPMYSQRMSNRSYDYYRCSKNCSRQIRSDAAHAAVEDRLMSEIGDVERTERVYVSGHGEDLAAVREAIDTVRREKDLGLYDGDDEGYFGRLESLVGKRRELESLPQLPGFEERSLGETYRQAWARMGAEDRRAMLLDSGIRVSLALAPVGRGLYTHVDTR